MRLTALSRYSCVAVLVVLPLTPAHAESSLGLGLGVAPDYIGSNDYAVIPLPSFSVQVGGKEVKSAGPGVEVNLGSARGVGFGPILRYGFGRNDGGKVADSVVALTAPVRAAPEIGGFVQMALPLGDPAGGVFGNGRLSLVQGLGDGHQGTVVEGSLGVVKIAPLWKFGGGLSATWGSDRYQQAFFDVSAADAASTGLSPYSADAGLVSVGLSGFASHDLSAQLSLNLFASVSRLTSDAANSPLVADRGSDVQSVVGVGLSYRFD
ncbi:MAG: MipA/OmpV family protein [Candidatus Saccharibacteria bacterium]|nr:MipA/OmpV family protein [Pseudorhodobacter sp.]